MESVKRLRDAGVTVHNANLEVWDIDRADRMLADDTQDSGPTSSQLDALATELEGDSAAASGRSQARLHSLAETVKGVAESLR